MASQTNSTELSGTPCGLQEFPRRVGAIELEAIGGAAVLFRQSDIVKHRSKVEQFGVEFPAPMAPPQRSPQIDPDGMMKQQGRLAIADKLRRLAGELGCQGFCTLAMSVGMLNASPISTQFGHQFRAAYTSSGDLFIVAAFGRVVAPVTAGDRREPIAFDRPISRQLCRRFGCLADFFGESRLTTGGYLLHCVTVQPVAMESSDAETEAGPR